MTGHLENPNDPKTYENNNRCDPQRSECGRVASYSFSIHYMVLRLFGQTVDWALASRPSVVQESSYSTPERLSATTYDEVFEKRILAVTGDKQSCENRLDSLTAELVSELATGKRELYVRDGSGRIVPLSELGRQSSASKRIIILGSR